MHHLGVNTNKNLVDAGAEKTTIAMPVCPKPRRLGSAIPDFLNPPRCSKHSHPSADERSEVLNIIDVGKKIDGREALCSGCTPSCYAGSPPGRTSNPLVHDVNFIHQMEIFSPFARTNLADKFGGLTSASPV